MQDVNKFCFQGAHFQTGQSRLYTNVSKKKVINITVYLI